MRMTNFWKLAAIGLITITVACSISPELDAEIDAQEAKTQDLARQASVPQEPIPDDVVRVKNDIWLGDTSTIEFEGEAIPSYLETKDGITLISNRPITLYEIGNMISKITSLSVRYAPELEETEKSRADGNKPALEDLGAQWTDSTRMIVNYKGPMSGLLDEVANRFGIWWKYEKKEVYFYKYITKTFVLYSLPTNPSLSVSIGDSGGENSVSSITQSGSVDGLDMWSNIESTINSMITSDANLVIDKGNGTITLTATPTDIKRVAKYVNEQNERLSKQVAISVKVFQVNVTNNDHFGLDLSSTLNIGGSFKDISAGTLGPQSLDTDLSKISMGFTSKHFSINSALSALSKEGHTNLVTSGTVTTMNNKPAPIQVVKTQNYISELTKTNSGDSDTYDISVDTEEIQTGFTMSVLPRILDHGRMMVYFNLTLSDLMDLEEVTIGKEDDGQKIQNPKIESRGFTQEVTMKSGETMILAGFERVENTTDKEGVGNPKNWLFGGNQTATRERSVLVIMLTPVVLESPLTPESRMKD